MNKTSIQWTDYTWNPVTGCKPVSPGCKNCYAEATTERFAKAFPNGFNFTIHPDRFREPYRIKTHQLIFTASMSDLFHEQMPPEVLQELFKVMVECHWHNFQILTKRHERLAKLARQLRWPENIWIGVSVETQAWADKRIPHLRTVPATMRFLSVEPLLEPIHLNLDGISWVIVGGESGHGARPMDIAWARKIRDQCKEAGVAFFMKQLGGRSRHRGQMSDFPPDLRIRQWPDT